MSAAPHLRLVDTETGEMHEQGACPHCADAQAEAEVWEREVLKLKRQIKRLTDDRDAAALRDRYYPAAHSLFEEWQIECNHPNAKFDPARVRLALGVVKRYKDERDKLSWVIQAGKHLAYTDPQTGERHDGFGLLFRDSDHIERYANKWARWVKRNGTPS